MTGRILQNGNVIEVRQGDSFTIRLNITKNSSKIDFTDAVISMQVRGFEDNTLKFDLLATSIDVEKGQFALILTPMHTGISVGDYKTDIQLTTKDGSINTIFPADVNKVGILRITEQVTR
jgi:hypothetical protein